MKYPLGSYFLIGSLTMVILINLQGCGTNKTRPAHTDEGAPGRSLWMGQPVSKLIEVRGAPDFKLNVPSGDAYVYKPFAKVRMDIESKPNCQDTYLVNYKQRIVGFYCQ